VQALFGCGLGRKAAPKTFAGSDQMYGRGQKQNRFKKYPLVVLLLPTAICFLFFSSLPDKSFCHVFRARACLILFFSLRGQGQTLTQPKSVCTGLWPPFLFCGGAAVAAMPFVRARLVPRQAPPHPHTPAAGALADARVG
jgi:hypothetical protein